MLGRVLCCAVVRCLALGKKKRGLAPPCFFGIMFGLCPYFRKGRKEAVGFLLTYLVSQKEGLPCKVASQSYLFVYLFVSLRFVFLKLQSNFRY